jgi:succinate dehydrogenase / fumarate reductase cytochrome b subunit
MSGAAIEPAIERTYRLYDVSVGKKVVMAVTGVILFGYVVGHLAGNLQIFIGEGEQINRYAEFLHASPAALWAVRAVLLAAVGLHIISSVQLWLLKRKARPIPYVKKDDVPSAYAARTMMWSGPIIAAFVVFHVMHLTVGNVPGLALVERPEGGYDVYRNVIVGFRSWWVTASYVIAVVLLTTHLYHGIWSMFQSVGVSHPRYTPVLQKVAHAIAIAIAAGYISIPAAVLLGVIGAEVR